jgi:lipoprotein-anchoring transpeptidase ErfK/SrfK
MPLFFFISVQVAFAQVYTTDKLITVDLGSQKLYTWENGVVQKSVNVSTGMYYTPTVRGDFKVYKKIFKQDMRGYFPPYEPYYVRNVPHVMYFHGAFAIHGTYWHNKFGSRASHGCVNLPLKEAAELYTWADVGTRVIVF